MALAVACGAGRRSIRRGSTAAFAPTILCVRSACVADSRQAHVTSNLPDPQTDLTASLVLRLRRGDSAAGVLLNDLYREALVRFCRGYLGRQDEAEDAVQEISFRVLTAKTVPEAFRPWLYKIARNYCCDVARRRARRIDGAELPAASQIVDVLTGHLTRMVQNERRSRLADLVRTLSAEQQEALRLRYVEGLTRAEVAEVLDISETGVKSLLFRGVQFLREQAALFEGETT